MTTKHYLATFTEGLLATKPNDSAVHETYIAAKRRDGVASDELDAEARTLAEIADLEKGVTVFHRTPDGRPMVWDYQIKGFLKEAVKALRRDPETACAKLKNYKGVIDGSVFVKPRQIPLVLPDGASIGTCQRPLRAQTMQGERVALAQSEEAPAGTKMEFSVLLLAPGLEAALAECWQYAQLRFMGAWRNSGKGTAEIVELEGGKSAPNTGKAKVKQSKA